MKWKYFHLSIFFIPSLPFSSFSFHLKFVCVCLNTIWSSLLLFSFFPFWGYVFRSRSHTSIKQTNRLYSSKITSQSFKHKTLNNRHNISKPLLILKNLVYTTNTRKFSYYNNTIIIWIKVLDLYLKLHIYINTKLIILNNWND